MCCAVWCRGFVRRAVPALRGFFAPPPERLPLRSPLNSGTPVLRRVLLRRVVPGLCRARRSCVKGLLRSAPRKAALRSPLNFGTLYIGIILVISSQAPGTPPQTYLPSSMRSFDHPSGDRCNLFRPRRLRQPHPFLPQLCRMRHSFRPDEVRPYA